MITKNKNYTINLVEIIEKQDRPIKFYLKKFLAILILIFSFGSNTGANYNEMSMKDKIRLDRLIVCQEKIKAAEITNSRVKLNKLVISCALRLH